MLATPARAQLGASLSLQSDQRFRGVSISDEKPAAQLRLGYDFDSGCYAGAMLGRMHFGPKRDSALVQTYLGRVMALRPGLDIEAGLTHTRFPGVPGYDYSEGYAGLIAERWSARLYGSPHYFRLGGRSFYAEFNGHWPVVSTLQVIAHFGALNSPAKAYKRNPNGPTRLDLRVGLSWRYGLAEFQLAWVSADRGGPSYPSPYAQQRNALVIGTQFSF